MPSSASHDKATSLSEKDTPPLLNPNAIFGLDPGAGGDNDEKTRRFKLAYRKASLLCRPDH